MKALSCIKTTHISLSHVRRLIWYSIAPVVWLHRLNETLPWFFVRCYIVNVCPIRSVIWYNRLVIYFACECVEQDVQWPDHTLRLNNKVCRWIINMSLIHAKVPDRGTAIRTVGFSVFEIIIQVNPSRSFLQKSFLWIKPLSTSWSTVSRLFTIFINCWSSIHS